MSRVRVLYKKDAKMVKPICEKGEYHPESREATYYPEKCTMTKANQLRFDYSLDDDELDDGRTNRQMAIYVNLDSVDATIMDRYGR